MDWLLLVSAALGTISVLILLRQLKSESAAPLSLAVCVMLLGGTFALLGPTIASLRRMLDGGIGGEYIVPLLKGMGVSMITQTAADVCRDSGESAVAAKVELIGRAELLAICLPLMQELFELARSVAGVG